MLARWAGKKKTPESLGGETGVQFNPVNHQNALLTPEF